MAWTEITRPKYQRDGLRYASDTVDAEWAVIEPHLPPPAHRGRTRTTKLRDVVNAIFYIAQSGCQWRLLPKDFPPYTTVQRYFVTTQVILLMGEIDRSRAGTSQRVNGTARRHYLPR